MNKIVLKTKQTTAQQEKITNKIEEVDKRTIFTKNFINEDGSHTLEISGTPIHYYNPSTQTYEECNTSLTETDNTFQFKGNQLSITFKKEITNDQSFLDINHKNHPLKMFYMGKVEKNGFRKIKKVLGKTKSTNQLSYEQIEENVNLEYKVEANKIKENIIIKAPQETYEFEFKMNIKDLKAQLSKNEQNIELLDQQNTIQYIIPSPYMFDNNNQYSNDIGYEIVDEGEGILTFTLKADSSWINNPERVFPVTLDPEIIIQLEENEFMKHYYVSDNHACLPDEYNETNKKIDFLIDFNLNYLLNQKIIEVKLNFNLIPSSTLTDIFVNEYRDPQHDWYQNNFNINTENMREFENFYVWKNTRDMQIDLTVVFKDWIKAKLNTGMILFHAIEKDRPPIEVSSFTLFIKYNIDTYLPINYLNLKNSHLIESIYNVEVGLLDNVKKLGILTTFCDLNNEKVYQQYQIENLLYTRESKDLQEWSEWRNHSMKAELVEKDLYLSDQ